MITATCVRYSGSGLEYELSESLPLRGDWTDAAAQTVRAVTRIRVSASTSEVVIRPLDADGKTLRKYQGGDFVVWQFVPDGLRDTFWLHVDEVLRRSKFVPAYPDLERISPLALQRQLDTLVGVMRQYDPAGGGWSPRP